MDILADIVNMIGDMLYDWPVGTIIGIFVVGACVALIGMVALGLFVAVDSLFLPRQRKMGRVIGKTFTPEHTQVILIYNHITKTALPHPVFHPNDWSVTMEIDGRQDDVSVTKDFFDSLSKNDFVLAEYVSGRFSGGLYIKALFPKT